MVGNHAYYSSSLRGRQLKLRFLVQSPLMGRYPHLHFCLAHFLQIRNKSSLCFGISIYFRIPVDSCVLCDQFDDRVNKLKYEHSQKVVSDG